jgi:hypothetical protein
MKHKTVWLLAGVLATGLIAAGCGGDDNGDDGGNGGNGGTAGSAANGEEAAAAPSKEEYLAEGDRICTEANNQLEQAFEGAPATTEPGAREDFVNDEMVPIYRDMFRQLEGLTPPDGDEDTVAEIYDTGRQGVDEIEDDPSSFLQSGRAPTLDEAAGLATQYGFKVCGLQGN